MTDLLTGSGHTFRFLERKIPAHSILDTARGHGVTLSSAVMLAWIRTLQLMTGVYEEILVGVTVSGRDGRLEGIDTVVGLLIETIPFVGPLLYDKSDRRQLHEMALQLSDSQEHLCASLNDIQHWTDRKSLFQSVCVHENYPVTDTDALFASVLVHERTHFPLAMLSVVDAEGNLRLQLQGNMEVASLERLSSALCSQLANLANPDAHFKDSDQTLLVSDQRLTWTMGDFLAASTSMARDSVALVDGDVQLSYDLVEGEVERMAIGLETKFNVQPQDVVGVMLPRGAPMMLTIWAIMHLGAVYMPLQPDLPAERIHSCVRDSNAAVIVNLTIFEQLSALASSSGSTLPSPSLDRWSASYIIFTSGSTGKPKGVVNTVGGIVNRLMWMQSEVSITANDILVQKTNPMFDVSMWETLLPFAVGGRLTLLEYQMEKDFEATSKRLARHEVTIVHFVPSVLSAMLVVPEDFIWATPLGAVRSVICSGEALGTAVLTDLEAMQFPGTVINLYGPTEAAVDVTILHDAIGVAAN